MLLVKSSRTTPYSTVWSARFLLVLDEMGESRLNLCRPKDTSSLQGLLLTTTGLLLELCVRPRGEYFISDPLTL